MAKQVLATHVPDMQLLAIAQKKCCTRWLPTSATDGFACLTDQIKNGMRLQMPGHGLPPYLSYSANSPVSSMNECLVQMIWYPTHDLGA